MSIRLLFFATLFSANTFSQVPVSSGVYFAKEFSKDVALYKAKEFVMKSIIGLEKNLLKFSIDPLAASSSGELTSLVYSCDQKKLSGLVLGFFGDYVNPGGLNYQGYAFKNLSEDEALELLNKLDKYINQESKYMSADYNNNMFFQFDDMTFLVYKNSVVKIRVFWNGFDSEWESTAFERTKKRFERHLNKN